MNDPKLLEAEEYIEVLKSQIQTKDVRIQELEQKNRVLEELLQDSDLEDK